MSIGVDGWIPKYILQEAGFRAGTTPTPERFNELFDLLITQGDFNTQTIHTLLQNLAGFEVEFSNTVEQNNNRYNELVALMTANFNQFHLDNELAHSNMMTQMTQAVELMLNDYVTKGNMSSQLSQKENEILMQVTNQLETGYVDNATLQSTLQLTSTNITQTVSTMLQDYATLQEMEASIDLRAGSITQTVSEQINGIDQRVTVAQQTANKFTWLVKSGDNETNFMLSDRVINLVSENIDITGFVTFNSLLDPDSITTINGGYLTSAHIEATTGEIAGFFFSNEEVYGGLIYNNPENGKYIRFSPYSSHTGGGEYNPNYGALDLGMVNDDGNINTLIHLRSDGYARFGLVSSSGTSVRFNDFLRRDAGVEGATDTILYSQNFQINRDGTVEINSNSIAKSLKSINVTKSSGQISKLDVTFDDDSSASLNVEYNADGDITKVGDTVINY